ncbi:MAG TPA: hypothetical protein VKL61_10185, partial [Candidatus Polarisedimenticolia bacterium]|nr:hypothetical protein [Candidatus Polarisedimenticolia bacterium]
MVLALLLVFCSTSLLILGVAFLFLRRRSRSVDTLMRSRLAAVVGQHQMGDADLPMLRDQAFSNIGLLQRLLLKFRTGGKLRRLLEQADIRMRTGTLVLQIGVFALVGFLVSYAVRLGTLLSV